MERMTQSRTANARGFTLIELMIVVAVIGILAAIAIPIFSSLQVRARIAKATADVRTIASAVMSYSAHTTAIPSSAANLSAGLTTSTTVGGVTAGPFLPAIPNAPPGGTPLWNAYLYSPDIAPGGGAANGAYVVCTSGDGSFANSGGVVSSCP